MPFQLLYHAEVRADIAKINEKLKTRIKKAIETRLAVAPQQYGEPLRKTLKGYWKMRVGDHFVGIPQSIKRNLLCYSFPIRIARLNCFFYR